MSLSRTRSPRPLGEIVGALVTPVCRRRGVANAALLLDPAELFGERFVRGARVERIVWPRAERHDEPSGGATLVVQADAATALALQHVTAQLMERANIIIGWPAITRVRVIQTRRPVPREGATPRTAAVAAPTIEAVAATLDGIDHQELKLALARLGAGTSRRRLTDPQETP